MKRIEHQERYFGDMIKENCLQTNVKVKRFSKIVFGLNNRTVLQKWGKPRGEWLVMAEGGTWCSYLYCLKYLLDSQVDVAKK